MNCGFCKYNDGYIYTSMPPKYRCTITGEYNFGEHKCDVDFVPVVRCMDCKYSVNWYGDKARCFLWSKTGIDVFKDGFCSYGKRGDNATD